MVFVGHFAIGLAAKPLAPKVSLALLFLAGAFFDLTWILFFAAGIEHVKIEPGIMVANSLDLVYVPFSHSLVMGAVWGGLFAAVYFLSRRDFRGAWILCAAVLSHWILDVIVHRPDMPLAPGIDLRFGLGLWNSRPATFIVEGGLWLTAIVFYARSTTARTRTGSFAFWSMIIVLTALWGVSLRGDPPPNLSVLAISNIIFLSVLEAWALWMNHNRKLRPAMNKL